MHRSLVLTLLLAVSCSGAAEVVSTTPPTTPAPSTSTTTTYAADSPAGIAAAFMGYVQSRDCEAALALSTPFMWGQAMAPDQALLNCPAVLAAVPEITAVVLTDVTTREDVARELGVEPDDFSMDVFGYPDAAVFFDVTYVSGATAVWLVVLGDFGPDGWSVVSMGT